MKLLITALSLAVLAYACERKLALVQKESERDSGSMQTLAVTRENPKALPQILPTTFLLMPKRNSIVWPNEVFVTKNNFPLTGSINVEMKRNTKALEMIPNKVPKQSVGYHLLPAEDFLFVSLIMVN
jgi:hypothetical protein